MTPDIRRFLQACEDWGNMSSGQFREKYPDYLGMEGYGYIHRWAMRLKRAAAA